MAEAPGTAAAIPADKLEVSFGQRSVRGRKAENQDFHGALVPRAQDLALKGAAFVVADGISTSRFGRAAAETAVGSFLADYFCTPDSWKVKTAGYCVIAAANAWLHAQTRRSLPGGNRDQGYITTFSALVAKGRRAHLFHVGDSRISRFRRGTLEQLTTDHRIRMGDDRSYLSRAMGLEPGVEIEYCAASLQPGDIFVLETDGVHEFLSAAKLAAILGQDRTLDDMADSAIQAALDNGSDDNLTVQIVRVDALPPLTARGVLQDTEILPPAQLPKAGDSFEGYRIVRPIHASARSHVFLAIDPADGSRVTIKIPSIDMRDDTAHLRRLSLEEWVARRVRSAHVISAPPRRERDSLCVVTEYVDGQSLRQWMTDNPAPNLETVRRIAVQIAKGLYALHRREVIHQDLRPENVLLDEHGTAKICDLGSVRVAGVIEAGPDPDDDAILGTVQYSAPEYFLGQIGTDRSDQFSLGVIVYEMLTGRLPYGAHAARVRTRKDQMQLRYRPAEAQNNSVPAWIDAALRRAVHPDRARRYPALSEFIADLHRPNPLYLRDFVPLAERDPVRFWRIVSAVLALLSLFLLLRSCQ